MSSLIIGTGNLQEDKVRAERLVEIDRFMGMYPMNPVFEHTWRNLKDGMDKPRLARSKLLHTQYKGVLDKKGWIKFVTESQYTKGKYYYQYIKLLDMKDLEAVKEYSKRDIMRLMLSGDIAVYCSCPDYLYRGFKYMGKKDKYGIYNETRYPKIRNPKLEGTVCKHLGVVLSVYMTNWMKIYKDMVNSPYFISKF